MKRITDFLLARRLHAIIAVLLLTAVPLLGWLAWVIVALVTLRKGWLEGLWVLIAAVAPYIASAYMVTDLPIAILLFDLFVGMMLLYVMALVLRVTQSWQMAVYCWVLCALSVIGLFHLVVADPSAWWQQQIFAYLQTLPQELVAEFDKPALQQIIAVKSQYATGIEVATFGLANVVSLALARALQAAYVPAGLLRQELLGFRLSKSAVLLAGLVVVGAMFKIAFAIDVLPVCILPFVLAGMSIVHALLATLQQARIWLPLYYVGLCVGLLLFFIYVLGFMTVLALIDSAYDLRKQYVSNK